MSKLNCWEHMQCGREPGGVHVDEFGVCPAATQEEATGINDGINAGRYCWVVSGTFCNGKIQGNWAKKLMNCTACSFYQSVKREEGREFTFRPES